MTFQRFIKVFSLLCSISLAFSVSAQETLDLGLQDCVTRALTHSIALKKAGYDKEALVYKAKEAKQQILPQVNTFIDLSASPLLPTQVFDGRPFGLTDATLPVQVGGTWNLGIGLTVQQLVFDEKIRRSVPAAKLGSEIVDQMTIKSENEVRYQAAQLFLTTQKTEALLITIKANDAKLEGLEKTATLLYTNDLGTNLDIKRIQVARTNLAAKLRTLEDGIHYQKEILQLICGIRTGTQLNLLSSEEPLFIQYPSTKLSVEERLLTSAMELTKTQIHAGKASVLPTVSAYLSAGVQSPRSNANFLDSEGNWYGAALVGIRAQSPIFDTFKPKQKQLELEMLKHDADLEQLKKYEDLERRTKTKQLETAKNNVRVQEQNLALAKEVQDKMNLQYREGLISLSEMLTIQTEVMEAEATLVQQKIDVRLSELEILKVNQALQSLSVTNK